MAALQESMTEEVRGRLLKAAGEIGEKYSSGAGSVETSIDGPTGAAYREKQAAEAERKRAAKLERAARAEEDARLQKQAVGDEDLQEDGEGDQDYELRLLREARLKQIKSAHKEKIENIGKGHGQYREITQDEFLSEVTGSYRVVCHFYHRDFPRCKIIDHHIQRLVARHVETKFIKINAEKAPFFTEKLTIRTIPTVVLFFDGVAKGKIIGFDGLTDGLEPGKEDEFPTIRLARLLGANDAINEDAIIDDDEVEAANKAKFDAMRMNAIRATMLTDLEADDDFDDI